MNKVAILMSTYNGERYLRQQIDTIIDQKGVIVTLFIRDDGSKDDTISIIKDSQKKHLNIRLIEGENCGVGNSFMNLVYDAPSDFDFYAFADQDDIWLPEKIIKAIEKISMHEPDEPVLYCSNQILVDKDLNTIGMRYDDNPDTSFQQIMCQNRISGCTMVWNRNLHEFLSKKEFRPTKELLNRRIHDVWVAMVTSLIGLIIYDSNSYILYRQHDGNVVGIRKTSILIQWMDKLRTRSKRNGRSMLCREVYNRFSEEISDDMVKKEMMLYSNYNLSYYNKIRLAFDYRLLKNTGETHIGYSLKVLAGLF